MPPMGSDTKVVDPNDSGIFSEEDLFGQFQEDLRQNKELKKAEVTVEDGVVDLGSAQAQASINISPWCARFFPNCNCVLKISAGMDADNYLETFLPVIRVFREEVATFVFENTKDYDLEEYTKLGVEEFCMNFLSYDLQQLNSTQDDLLVGSFLDKKSFEVLEAKRVLDDNLDQAQKENRMIELSFEVTDSELVFTATGVRVDEVKQAFDGNDGLTTPDTETGRGRGIYITRQVFNKLEIKDRGKDGYGTAVYKGEIPKPVSPE